MFITLPEIFRQMPMGRLFAVIFFLSVAFAGITSLINMFEAVSESWQNRFKSFIKEPQNIILIVLFILMSFLALLPLVVLIRVR